MKKKISSLLVIIAICLISLLIFKNIFIKSLISLSASGVVGAPVKIGGFSLGVFKQSVRIKDFRIYNPKGYPDEAFLDIAQISVDYDLASLLKKKLHLPFIALDLRELVVIKNKEGKLNVDSLKVAQAKERAPKKEEKPAEMMPMQIDVLKLNIGQVIFKDFSAGGEPSIQAFEIGVKDKTYTNITSAQQLAALVMVEAMKGTTIKGASIYGAASVLGTAFLPAGVAGILIGKDSSRRDFDVAYDKAYDAAVAAIKEMGELVSESRDSGLITARVQGCKATLKIVKIGEKSSGITVSARKVVLPKPEIAAGIMHQISQRLKK
ncbi:MAG: hypothetical protein COV72_04655 [Candidatus Omnitrophica bacterium CG11_big_fil_rev_8_21_14_0_20_42_13]|uniref:AsmA domain-containing protein n=1 Tax=Candidatus Ghiorseimicrobium undicola TaxID=1974746 RepID=A0A2H0LXF7_9BACT|nr:MAG: hypothetical protein COV72_04655 [Candidatus Omnitrophica bacterium CG11_big_fil_rev_8_21_14_0_20_42_13]